MVYSFNDAAATEAHNVNTLKFGNRRIYLKGWTAVTKHEHPGIPSPMPAFDDDVLNFTALEMEEAKDI